MEGQGPVEICVEVLAGDITGNSYIISYSTTSGLAEGIIYNCKICCITVIVLLYEHSLK